ncbi:MAG: deoxyribonuclease V [Phycisphaerae bacterium]|nr:deoxyribonuclease V [Phycisphaerae bacterium]
MEIKDLHHWTLTYAEARALQTQLARQVKLRPIGRSIRSVAGLDCAVDKKAGRILAAVVVMSFPGLQVIETAAACAELTFPYVPGLLSFRESPVCLAAAAKLRTTPDLFLIDGQGIAHPRRLGLASHLGLFLDRPTIGCAKSRLIGTYDEPGPNKGDTSPLCDGDQTLGAVVRTRTGVKPLFISPGHLCTLEDAIFVTLLLTDRYRLPEPTRLAHQQVTAFKKKRC